MDPRQELLFRIENRLSDFTKKLPNIADDIKAQSDTLAAIILRDIEIAIAERLENILNGKARDMFDDLQQLHDELE